MHGKTSVLLLFGNMKP